MGAVVTGEMLAFFCKKPQAFPLYEAVLGRICAEFEDVAVKVGKSQIAFANRYNFAFVSLPFRKIKGSPDVCLLLSFGLYRHVEHPRVKLAVEPYPNRWTHHIVIADVNEIDDQVMEWVREAHGFSMRKR